VGPAAHSSRGPRASVEGGDGGARTHWVETLRRRASNHARARQDTLDLGEGASLVRTLERASDLRIRDSRRHHRPEDAEGQVRESETRLSRIITSAADAIISIDSEQRIVIFNEGAERIFGWMQEEVLGRPLDILLPARFREVHRAHAQRFAGEGKSSRRMGARRPVRGLRKDGQEFPAEASISRVDSGEGALSTVVLRDVTEQKREEHERDFLLQASAMLGSSLEYDSLVDGIIALSLQEFADYCVVSAFGPNGARTRRKIGKRGDDDPALRSLLESLPSDTERSQSLFESREPILLEEIDAAYIDARECAVEASLLRAIAPGEEVGRGLCPSVRTGVPLPCREARRPRA
jgi:PAS domain S-box-containing protein